MTSNMNKILCIISVGLLVSACTSSKTSMTEDANMTDGVTSTETMKQVNHEITSYNPTAASYNMQLGVAYMQQGDMQRAKRKLRMAEQQDPNSPIILDAMAYYLENVGEVGSAEKYYRKAMTFDKQRGEAQNNYGAFLCRRGRYTEAEKYFMAAVSDPNYLTPGQAYENAGLCALDVPNNQKAEQYFTKALQNNPHLATSSLEMAHISYDKQDYPQAKKYLENYAKYGQPSAESLYYRVKTELALGDDNAAASDLLLLKHRFPDSKEYLALKEETTT